MILAHRSLHQKTARVGERGAREGRGQGPRVLGKGRGGLKHASARGCSWVLRAPVPPPPVSAPVMASSVFTTLQVSKACGFGVGRRLNSEKAEPKHLTPSLHMHLRGPYLPLR